MAPHPRLETGPAGLPNPPAAAARAPAGSIPPPGSEGLETLSREECLRLLTQTDLGRVAVSVEALPAILPVHCTLVGDGVVFPAVAGGELEAAVRDAVVALEADHLDAEEGWSVVVTGVASEVRDPEQRELLQGPPVPAGAQGERRCFFRIPVEIVSGRRIMRPPMHVPVGERLIRLPVAVASRAVDADGAASDDFRFEPIPVDECLRLLETEEIGRLVVMVAGEPNVFPVNYILDGDVVVFRTGPGTKLAAISRSPVAFEVDRLAPSAGSGWSVVVEGIAQEVTGVDPPGLRERLAVLPLRPWAGGGDRLHYVRIVPLSITGARLRPAVHGNGREDH